MDKIIEENRELWKALLEVSRLSAGLQMSKNNLASQLEEVKYMITSWFTTEEIIRFVDHTLNISGSYKNPDDRLEIFKELDNKYWAKLFNKSTD